MMDSVLIYAFAAAALGGFTSPVGAVADGLLVGVVVRGLASVCGAIWGALFIFFVPNLAQHFSKAAPGIVFGAALFLVIYLMPSGIAGGVRRWCTKTDPEMLSQRIHEEV